MKIKAIIFDYGGVLTVGRFFNTFAKKYADKFNVDSEELLKIIRENWQLAKVNKINPKLFWERISEYLDYDKDKLRLETIQYFGFREELFKLIQSLKPKYKLVLLSNQIEDWLGEEIKKRNLNRLFDVIVTSYESKIAKPDVRIFQEVVNKLNVLPEECVLIDDIEENIIAGRKLGMKTILFRNLDKLKEELTRVGVKMD